MKRTKYLLTSLVVTMFLISCGGKEEKKKEGFSYEKSDASKDKEVKAEDDIATLVIAGDDLMKFDKTELRAKAGKKVKLTLRHKGKLDINVMGHNLVILKKGVNIIDFTARAATSKDTGYIPEGSENEIIAHTEMIGGGQTSSIEFNAPEAGVYDFICSFPGHSALMKGKFIVE